LLKDKVLVVTGSSRGIGFEIAKEFATRRATVIAQIDGGTVLL